MKILFDATAPAPLGGFLVRHDVVRAEQKGWQDLEIGDLLDAAEGERFDLVLTCAEDLPYDQNYYGRRLIIFVLWSADWSALAEYGERIGRVVDSAQAGQIIRVEVDRL